MKRREAVDMLLHKAAQERVDAIRHSLPLRRIADFGGGGSGRAVETGGNRSVFYSKTD
jgi:hypothetical protein